MNSYTGVIQCQPFQSTFQVIIFCLIYRIHSCQNILDKSDVTESFSCCVLSFQICHSQLRLIKSGIIYFLLHLLLNVKNNMSILFPQKKSSKHKKVLDYLRINIETIMVGSLYSSNPLLLWKIQLSITIFAV